MAAASVLTLLALGSIFTGIFLGRWRMLSTRLAAAGAGVLFGIAIFWLIPEIAGVSGWSRALLLVLIAACALAGLDQFLMHHGRSARQGVIGPLLIATALHSFLDGWSVRALSLRPGTDVAAVLGLGLHKIPEGLALGWITRRAISSNSRAAAASVGVEMLTLVGALVEREADFSGAARFGPWWTASVLAVIAGSFLFLSAHTVLPARRNASVLALFFMTLSVVGGARALG